VTASTEVEIDAAFRTLIERRVDRLALNRLPSVVQPPRAFGG